MRLPPRRFFVVRSGLQYRRGAKEKCELEGEEH